MNTATAVDLGSLRATLADNIENMLTHARRVGLTSFSLKTDVAVPLSEVEGQRLLAMLRAAEKHDTVQHITVRGERYSKRTGGYVLVTVTLVSNLDA